jgi:receptor expression-enhancing protein 5/6
MAQVVKQNVEDWKSKLDSALHEQNCLTGVLEKIESKTGVKRLHIALGVIAFIGVYLMIGYGADFLCNFIGFLYPAYCSIKAIESKEKDDDTKWLTYWVVYSFFHLLEFFADIFLFWIPFYWFFKCLFLVYCFAPMSWNGSLTIYNKLIRPFVLKHQKRIDETLNKAAGAARTVLDEAQDIASEAASDLARKQFTTKFE